MLGKTSKSLYRDNVAGAVFNSNGALFVGKRKVADQPVWQFPQGGIDANELPEKAFLRELFEETGITSTRIIARLPEPLRYDLPPEYRPNFHHGRYRGQQQQWFLAYFYGDDSEIDISGNQPEFSAWQWVPPEQLWKLPLPTFKIDLYRKALLHFLPIITRKIEEGILWNDPR